MYRPFNASGEAGTCIWCGNKLRKADTFILDGETRTMYGAPLGDYGDGVFCGLRCGYLFGKSMAVDHGKRLSKTVKTLCLDHLTADEE